MKPLISIVIPIYNVDRYLNKCLNSVVNQKKDNYEIILVDDGSTDSSGEICDKYQLLYKNIRVVHKKNEGLVNARKTGARLAKGEYIACVDGDDWVSNNYIDAIEQIIDKNKPDIICFNYYECLDNKKTIKKCFLDKSYNRNEIVKDIFPCLIQKENFAYFSPAIWNKVFKKNIYLETQLNVNEKIKIGEDGACVIPCIYKANSLVSIEKALYNYRINNNSMTKGKYAFDLYGPKEIIKNIKTQMDFMKYDFEEQSKRFLVHQLFIVVLSQFSTKNSFKEIKKEVNKAIDDNIYSEAIETANITNNIGAQMCQLILKKRMMFVMFLISKLK